MNDDLTCADCGANIEPHSEAAEAGFFYFAEAGFGFVCESCLEAYDQERDGGMTILRRRIAP